MLSQIRKTIEIHSMLEQGDQLVVAVSGGPDSVALLRILVLLSEEYKLCLTTAHLNHGLRKDEADRDEAFVCRYSAVMGIPCICKKVDIFALNRREGRSLEEIGREERYRFLRETAERCGALKIAVGHNRDDQAETVLHHMLRGSGTTGLRGILPVWDGRIIRPLLDVGRTEILDFLRRERLEHVRDSSNENNLFLRNRIRNVLIPELVACYNPKLIGGLCQTAGIMRREDDYLRGVVQRIMDRWGIVPGSEEVVLQLHDFLALHEAIQGRIIKSILEGLTPRQKGIGCRHIEAVRALAHRDGCRPVFLDLPFLIRVERHEDMLRIRRESARRTRKKEDQESAPLRFEYPVNIPTTIYLHEIERTIRLEWVEKPRIEEIRNRPETAFMDYECMVLPLILRNIRPGDRVRLLGTGGTKKLKDHFIDRKIEARCRREIPLLVDAASVVWIAGGRISERVRVTEKTSKVLKAEIIT